jgi:uncharacterized protein
VTLIDLIILAVAGLSAGILAGLLGVGGGILLVPLLRLLADRLGLPPDHAMHIAVATSMAVIVPTAISSTRGHAQRGAVDQPILRRWGPAMAIGALAASLSGGWISTLGLSLVFALTAGFIGVRMALGLGAREGAGQLPAIPQQIGLAGLIGAISAWMGIGGGTLSVPALSRFGTAMHRAVGTGAALGLAISVPALLGWIASGWPEYGFSVKQLGFVNVPIAAVLLPATLLAAPWGVRLAHHLPAAKLKRLFGVFLLLSAVAIILRSY